MCLKDPEPEIQISEDKPIYAWKAFRCAGGGTFVTPIKDKYNFMYEGNTYQKLPDTPGFHAFLDRKDVVGYLHDTTIKQVKLWGAVTYGDQGWKAKSTYGGLRWEQIPAPAVAAEFMEILEEPVDEMEMGE